MSYSASTIGLPQLRASSSASCAAFCRIFSANRNSTRPRSCRGRAPRTIFESRLRSSNSAVHVVGVGIRNLRDHFLRCGIVDRKCLARLAFNPLAVDVHLVCANLCLYPCWHGDLHQLAELRSAGHYVILLTCTGETPAPTSLVVDLRRP